MGPSNKSRIVVVGAGIVGISSALYLQKAGFEVTLVDRDAPGNGASFGNAGAIAPHAFVPVNSPSMPRSTRPSVRSIAPCARRDTTTKR